MNVLITDTNIKITLFCLYFAGHSHHSIEQTMQGPTHNARKPPDLEPLNLSNKPERPGNTTHTSEANGKIAGTCCVTLSQLIYR